jgi:acyl-CoA thioesterase FadM
MEHRLQDINVAFAHSVAVGLPMEKYRSLGAFFVVRRHEVDYLRSAVLAEELEVETRVTESSLVTAHRQTFIRRVSDGQLMVQAKTHWAYVSTTTGRARAHSPGSAPMLHHRAALVLLARPGMAEGTASPTPGAQG